MKKVLIKGLVKNVVRVAIVVVIIGGICAYAIPNRTTIVNSKVIGKEYIKERTQMVPKIIHEGKNRVITYVPVKSPEHFNTKLEFEGNSVIVDKEDLFNNIKSGDLVPVECYKNLLGTVKGISYKVNLKGEK